jgi:prevent-host-death family protein
MCPPDLLRNKVKDGLSRFLRDSEKEEVLITRHGKPAGVLIGFERKNTGLTIGSRTTHSSCVALRGRDAVLRLGKGLVSKTCLVNRAVR